jgi:toxin ParE1/3/4
MRIRYSPRAINDLRAIADYLTERSPSGARAVEQKIKAAIDALSEFPGIGKPVTGRPDVRVMPVVRFPYLIFYTLSGDELLVLHIRHGARAPITAQEL